MNSNFVFVDTEFTSLGSDPKLISIAMVTGGGDKLYIELTSGWSTEMCSKWVAENVLPLLGEGERLHCRDAARRIDVWLEPLVPTPALVVDSDWDRDLLSLFFFDNGVPNDKYRIEVLAFPGDKHRQIFEAARQEYFLRNLNRHHALVDACAFRQAWYEAGIAKAIGEGDHR